MYNADINSVIISGLRCLSNEQSLQQCRYDDHINCASFKDIEIDCRFPIYQKSLYKVVDDTKLAAPPQIMRTSTPSADFESFEGIVEKKTGMTYRRVCGGSEFTAQEARLFCEALGFSGALASIKHSSEYRQLGVSPKLETRVKIMCRGHEKFIGSCRSVLTKSCLDDAALSCENIDPAQIRLSDEVEGLVEIYHKNEWGTICDVNFTVVEAKVICKTLGFNPEFSKVGYKKNVPGKPRNIWLSGVKCNGPERAIEQCEHNIWGDAGGCEHDNDVFIHCTGNGQWSVWSEFTNCSKMCGMGERTRFRICNNVPPSSREATCEGKGNETERCNTQRCPNPIDGQWSEWNITSQCSVTCGGGTLVRERKCNNPTAMYGGLACEGASLDNYKCNSNPCPAPGQCVINEVLVKAVEASGEGIHERPTCNCNCSVVCSKVYSKSVWGFWSAYSGCSHPCVQGFKRRTRMCHGKTVNGKETKGECEGKSQEEKPCSTSETCYDAYSNKESCHKGSPSRLMRSTAKDAVPHSHPWIASFYLNNATEHVCSGALINEEWVITAAQCFYDSRDKCLAEHAWTIRLGKHNRIIQDPDEDNQSPAKIYIHPKFQPRFANTPGLYDYDIALVRLPRKVKIGTAIQPVCIHEENLLNYTGAPVTCISAGFSTLAAQRLLTIKTLESNLVQHKTKPISIEECSKQLWMRNKVSPRAICTGIPIAEPNCVGDAGSPLVCDISGSLYLTGVSTYPDGCSITRRYGIYTNVYPMLCWIQETIQDETIFVDKLKATL
ncbi:unnamed protein product [Owenia fusiformis]|nr:unnamed protein product [Owenia fusiformis]